MIVKLVNYVCLVLLATMLFLAFAFAADAGASERLVCFRTDRGVVRCVTLDLGRCAALNARGIYTTQCPKR